MSERVQITDAMWDQVHEALDHAAGYTEGVAVPTTSGYKRLALLSRDVGLVADSLTDKDWPRHREALIDVAMSALAWVAALDHRKPDEWWLHYYEITPQVTP